MTALKIQPNFTQVTPRTWVTRSDTNNIYTLQLIAGSLHCNCPLGRKGQACCHSDRLAAQLKTAINTCITSPIAC